MGAKLGGGGGGPMAEINVTPLIDVVLVLLVVFMVVTPLMQAGLPVDLPQATEIVKDKADKHIVISVSKEKGWYVEQEEANADTLVGLINAEYRKNAERTILVKADKNLEYRQVREVMDVLSQNNITSVSIAASKE